VTLCYEGTLPAARIHELANAIGSPAFGCYFDLANVVWLGMDTSTEIRELGGLIRQVHMKESLVGPGDVRPGAGRVNYVGSVEALREIGYQGWVVLETPNGTIAEVAEDFAFTRRVFGAED
jgi:sugar phosphate isomerase/epimerase